MSTLSANLMDPKMKGCAIMFRPWLQESDSKAAKSSEICQNLRCGLPPLAVARAR